MKVSIYFIFWMFVLLCCIAYYSALKNSNDLKKYA